MFGLTKLFFKVAANSKKVITDTKYGWTHRLFPDGTISANHYYRVWDSIEELEFITYEIDRQTQIKVFNVKIHPNGQASISLTKEIKPYIDAILEQ